ncbi:MAG: Uma2 family endonuclease [Anaerolineaceae bacterium]|nr:Uma2 family endonuclease [Anaerolineaceae bacterium]
MTQAPTKTYTVEEFWDYVHLPENAGRRLELVNGEIVEMVPTGGEHGEITFDFGLLIGNFVKKHKLGRITAAETGYILGIKPDGKPDVRAPDIGFVRIERAPEPFGSQFIPLIPDLVVEVVSPGDEAKDVEEKIQFYLDRGVQLIWVMYPSLKSVIVRRSDSMKKLSINDILSGEDVLPGFEVKVSDIFPK